MPTKWPCDNAIACPCDENPLFNISSENPDPFTFFARRFFPNVPQINDPPGVFVAPSCGTACQSAVSQADADSCALREAVLCVQPPPPPDVDDPPLFGNNAISCQYDCPEGPPFIINIPAGTYLARTQELADLIAQSFCQADVLQFHHCEMPGPPPTPGTPCPIITGQSPASPINKQVGDDVTLVVNYTYASTDMLMFVWFLDGFPTYATMDATLTLEDLNDLDAGQYILGIFATGCFPVFSSPFQLNVSGCPAEVGPDAPNTLDIAAPVEWEEVTVNQLDLAVLVSTDLGSNPTGYVYFTPSYGLDHAPGTYGELYTSGFFDFTTASACGGTMKSGGISIDFLVNEQYNVDNPNPGGFASLNNGAFSAWTGTPPPGAAIGQFYLTGCLASYGDVQFDISTALAGTVFTNLPYPPNGTSQFKHSNIGGMFTYYFGEYTPFAPGNIVTPIIFKVLQLEGQIAQPRKLAINDFATFAAGISNPAIGANWDGKFPTRTTYTSTVLQWDAAASGGFGGATINYITNHPTSANGKGWRMNVYAAGPTLIWSGIKAVDETSIGRYYRDDSMTPTGPLCVSCIDDSTTDWFPPP